MYEISKLLLILQVLNLKQKVILNLRMVQVIRHFLENMMKGHEKVTTSFRQPALFRANNITTVTSTG
jgi:hypothetical protein